MDQVKIMLEQIKATVRIAQAIIRTVERDPGYWKGVVDRTGRGSEWTLAPEEVKKLLLSAESATPPAGTAAPGCSYYALHGNYGNTIGNQNIVVIGEDTRGLFVRKGAHGPEIATAAYRSMCGSVKPTSSGWLILGPDDKDGLEVVWTAYPGDMTRPADQEALKAILGDKDEAPIPDATPFVGCAAKLV